MAKTIGRFAPAEVPNAPASFDKWLMKQTGYNDRLDLIPSSISPTELDAIRTEAASGSLGRLFELYEKMVATDARIGGIVGSLRATVSGLPLKVIRAEGASAKESALAEDYRQVVLEALRQFDSNSFTSDLTDTYLYGTKAFQMRWEIANYPKGRKLALPVEIDPIPGQALKQEMTLLDPNWGKLKFVEYSKPLGTYFDDVDTRRAFVITDGTAKGRHDVIGALRRVLGWWITKMYAQLWWVEYVESYGQPIRVARYTEESSTRERAQLKQFLSTIGRQKWGLFPQGADIQLLEASQAGNITTFSDLIKVANHEIAVALIGQTGITTDSAQGSRAKLEVLDGVRLEIVSHVAQIVQKGYKKLSEAIIRANYGEDFVKRLVPHVRPIVGGTGAISEKVASFEKLSTMGIAIPLEEIHDQIGLPQPEEGQMVLFKGKIVEMTTFKQMQEDNDESNDLLAPQGLSPAGPDEESGDSDGSGSGETDQSPDGERTVSPPEE